MPAVYSPVKVITCEPTRLLNCVARIISSTPMTKVGVAMTTNEAYVTIWSLARYWRTAPQTPSSTPMTAPSSEPMRSRRKLVPERAAISAVTCAPPTVVPMENCVNSPTSQFHSRTMIGTSGFTPIAFSDASMDDCGGRGLMP